MSSLNEYNIPGLDPEDGEKNGTENKNENGENGKKDGKGPKKETNVACNAVTCVYNENKKCTADHIQIAGIKAMASGETECGTFQCK